MTEYKMKNGGTATVVYDLRDYGEPTTEFLLRGHRKVGNRVAPMSWTAEGKAGYHEGAYDLILPFRIDGVGYYETANCGVAHIVHIHEDGRALGYIVDKVECIWTWSPDGTYPTTYTGDTLVRKLRDNEREGE